MANLKGGEILNHKKVLNSMLQIFALYLDKEEYNNQRSICIANMRCVSLDIKKPSIEIQYLNSYSLFSSLEDDKKLYNVLYDYLHHD